MGVFGQLRLTKPPRVGCKIAGLGCGGQLGEALVDFFGRHGFPRC
jgi:hypothetical protein